MDVEYKSGSLPTAQLKEFGPNRLLELYNKMRVDGINFGLAPDRYKPVAKFSTIEEAIKRTMMIFSSVVAAKESHEAILREDNLPSQPIKVEMVKEVQQSTQVKKMSRPRTNKYGITENTVITLLTDQNPKRGKAFERFAQYVSGMTVGEYAEIIGSLTVAIADVVWDAERNWVSYENPAQTQQDEEAA